MGADSELELVVRVRDGDVDAFRQLYLANVRFVYRYVASHFAGCDADDITAETFERAWERKALYEWRGVAYKAWLLRIARNLALSRARQTMRRGERVEIDEETPSPEPGPAEVLAGRMDQASLRAMVAALPDLQREVIVLRFVEGLTAVEVAVVLDRRQEAIRSAQYRGLQTLRAQLLALDAQP